MSQAGRFFTSDIRFIEGDTGGPAASNPTTGIFTIVGGTLVSTVSDPALFTLTINVDDAVASSYVTDAGTAIPAANVLNVLGGPNINTAGAADTVTINLDDDIVVDSVTSSLYTAPAASDVVINMLDDAGAFGVVFTNDSDANVILFSSLGEAEFNSFVQADFFRGLPASDTILRMHDDAGAFSVSFHNDSDVEVAFIDSEGEASFLSVRANYTGVNNDFTIGGFVFTADILSSDDGSATDIPYVAHSISNVAAQGATIAGLRSRDSSGAAIVQSGDQLFALTAAGFDGTDYALSAEIVATVDATPGSGDMPGKWEFATSPDGTELPVVAMTIDSAQVVTLANPLAVGSGGTGVNTLTDHGVLLGSGTSAVTVTTVGTNGQVLIGATAADPAFASLTSADSSVAFATGANTLDLTVDVAAAGGVETLTGDSGGAISPTAGGDIGIAGGTNITTAGAANTITVNLDAAISLATSVTSPLYTVSAGDLILNMTDSGGLSAVSFTNNSDVEVAFIDSLGAAEFTDLDVDNISINGNTIGSSDTDGQINLEPDGTGTVNIAYLTQFLLPIAGALGAVQDLADGIGSSGQVLTSNGGGSEPTWEDASGGGGITWSVIGGTSQALVTLNGYFANNGGTVTFTLPATAAVGDTFVVAGMNNATGWTIAQNAGQTIHFGSQDTSTGAGGSLTSTATYDVVELVCNIANTDFVVTRSIGNITVV